MPRRRINLPGPGSVSEAGPFTDLPVLSPVCEAIRSRRLALGLEQKELAARLGVHKNAVSGWETGRSRPDFNLIPSLCRELGVSPQALFGMPEPHTPREELLLSVYRKLEERFRVHADTVLRSLLQAQDAENVPELFEIEFQPVRLAAGSDAAIRDIAESETLYLHDTPLLHRSDCVYKVNGDSMEPSFRDGDLVFVERIPKGKPLRFGEIGAFAVGSECYIKEYRQDGLHSRNGRYPVMRFDADGAADVYLIGRVLGLVDPELIASGREIRRYLEHRKSGA